MKERPRARSIPIALLLVALLLVAPLLPATVSLAQSEMPVDFHRDIKPLLSDRCFGCHGPDAATREADLNLSDRQTVISHVSESGLPLLEPGDPAASEIYRRITSSDPDEKMPPADAARQLDPHQIARIGRWIAAGADWEPHWSLRPLRDSPGAATATGENPIDSLLRARLAREGLTPAPPASGERILRRLSLDLTGLPPTPEEIDRFLSDRDPAAYERQVDRLLASPRYGVRMASPWLDLARYADTAGYQIDRYRDVWPWRDWVVRAMNDNMPFDQFITWQLAGDLLPAATTEQRLATAFNRLHRQNEESGAVPEEFRSEYVADRVITLGTAVLGLTLECARCHDHKYDAITQKEFYELCSFFDNIDEAGVNSSETDAMPTPTLLLADEIEQAKLAELDRKISRAETDRTRYAHSPDAHRRAVAWFAQNPDAPMPGPQAAYPLESFAKNRLENRIDPAKPGLAEAWPATVEGAHGKGILLNGDTRLSFKDVGVFSRADPFSLSLWIWIDEHKKRAVIVHRSRAALDAASRGYQLLLEDGRLSFGLAHMWPGNALRVIDRQGAPLGRWVHVAVTYDGSSRARGARIYLDGRQAEVDVIRDKLSKDILYDRQDIHLTIGERWRDAGFKNGRVDEFAVFQRRLTPLEIKELHSSGALAEALDAQSGQNASPDEELLAYYLENFDPEYRKLSARLDKLRTEQSALNEPIEELMVMREMQQPRPTHLLTRGLYDRPAERVFPGTPRSVLPLDAQLPRNRLGLARWLFDQRHPLTARVAVNRLWQLLFGNGLVSTPNDFGSQGTPPSHPELLDYLARRYIESGWDTKGLLRLIVNSRTYRQSSMADAAGLEKDPDNRLLSRGPRYRLSAEMIRDGALAAAGLLAEPLGGPPVYPYQPPGLWQEKDKRWSYEQSQGEGLYRRSLYTIWKRTSPPPAMVAFDAPSRSTCIVNRQRTGTPLQALVLLNDIQFVEAARCFAERILREGGPQRRQQIDFAFRVATGRRPQKSEAELLVALFDEQLGFYNDHPEHAEQLIQVGEKPVDEQHNPAELAALTTVASTLLNHDQFVTKR